MHNKQGEKNREKEETKTFTQLYIKISFFFFWARLFDENYRGKKNNTQNQTVIAENMSKWMIYIFIIRSLYSQAFTRKIIIKSTNSR